MNTDELVDAQPSLPGAHPLLVNRILLIPTLVLMFQSHSLYPRIYSNDRSCSLLMPNEYGDTKSPLSNPPPWASTIALFQ